MAERQTARKRRDAGGRAEPKRLRGIPGLADRAGNHLDRLVHERIRLAILSALAVNRSVTFSDLKELLGTSDGNLSVHARKLEEAGYLTCSKTFEGRFPKTEYKLTTRGRKALERYLAHMEALIGAMRKA